MSKKIISLLVCIAIAASSSAILANSLLKSNEVEMPSPPTYSQHEDVIVKDQSSDKETIEYEDEDAPINNSSPDLPKDDELTINSGTSSQDSTNETCTNSRGHLFDDWQNVIVPTYLSSGKEQRSCIHCNYSEERTVAQLNTEGVVATDSTGLTVYSSFRDAIDDSKTGDTIILLSDVFVTKEDAVDLAGKYKTLFNIKGKRLTIDLNGKTLHGDTAGMDEMLVGFFATEDCGHLTLNDSVGTGTVEIEANGAKVYGLIINYDPTSTITINGGNYKLDCASDSLVYSGGNECITITGGNFYLGNVGTGKNLSPWIFNVKGRNERHVTVTGGTFNWDIQHQYWPFEVDVPKEFALKETHSDGVNEYTIVDAVAYVNEQHLSGKWYTNNIGYATLQEAINAVDTPAKATTKEYVTLLKDLMVTDSIEITKDVTINLNKKTIRGISIDNASFDVFHILADVTVKNGTVDASENGYCFFVGNDTTKGDLKIDSGEYYGKTSVVQVTNGDLTINGGYFKATEYNGDHRYTLNCLDEAYINGDAKITVYAGTFYNFDPANNLAEGEGTDFTGDGELDIKIEGDILNDPAFGITVTKAPSLLPSRTVNINDVITYTITITNTSNSAKTVSAKDIIPANTAYISGADSVIGNELFWNDVILEKGQTIELTYSVKVNADASLYTDGVISAEPATVNGITVGTYPIYVRRTLTANDAEYLEASLFALNDSSYTSNTLLKWIYQIAYSKSTLISDTPENTLDNLFNSFDDATNTLRTTVAPTLYGGTEISAELDQYFVGDRATSITVESFNVGDVLLITIGSKSYIYLYFDGFIELTCGMRKSNTTDVLTDIKLAERYAVIRPSIYYPSISISNGMTDPSTLTPHQRILLLTAQNYLLRGERVQYDDTRLSSLSSSEYRWQYGFLAPEDYTADSWGYTNCAAFAHDLYLYGLGYELNAYTTSGFMQKTAYRVYYYQPTRKESESTITNQTNKFFSTLKVGDIIIIRRDKDGNGTDDSGHAMIYVGDGKVIHSSGSNYNYTNSKEVYEPSIRYLDLRDYLFTETSSNYVFGSTLSKLGVFRPLNNFKGSVPENSLNRVENLDGIRAEKISSVKGASSANAGDKITFTFKIFNSNPCSMPISITDTLSDHTSFIEAQNGSYNNGVVCFEAVVGAYETIELSYTVKINEDTANGTKISSDGAIVNGVSFKCHAVTVNRTLTSEEQEKIKDAIAYILDNNPDGIQGRALANLIYENAGFDAPFDSADSFTNIIYGILAKYNGSSTNVKVGTSGKYRHLLVDGLYGGRVLFTSQTAYKSGGDRTRLPKEHDLVTGDVILARSGSTYKAFIYDGEYIYDISTTDIVKLDPNEALEVMMAYQNYFVVLRPSYDLND